jgi:protein involved in polysaccharide export with SLBB domain
VAAVPILALAAPATGQASLQGAGAAAFQAGDAVRITVWRNPDLSGQFEIAEDGTIVHPLYRSIRAHGAPVTQVEAAVRGVLQRFESNPEFVVEPLFRVAVQGEVRSPNVYTLSPATTVPQAVIQAGGPTPQGRSDRIRLVRNGQTILVDLSRPDSELAELRIRSGDQIIIDRRGNAWRDVVQPVITMAGSLASFAVLFIRLRDQR